ncbi:MAG: long-chain fatty acid--CoA ligase, partial [Deltaproteobacteria bacterium]|nr:long-chain fatty acid--CoA ligase [Deltaproteobacteria bacterium]
RKKDLIVTSGGKKIAPQSIEKLLEASPFIDTAFLYGDGKKFLTALLVVKEMAELPIAQHVDAVNLQLSHFETIKKYTLLTKPFSVESGELTPTLKLRRREIAKKYHDLLEKMYASDHEESVAPRRKFL